MNHDLTEFIETRHYLFEWNTAENLKSFLTDLKKTSKSIKTFRGNIGEIYVSIKGIFDGSDVLNIGTTEDIIYGTYRKSMKILKEYDRKPSPQRYFKGDWVTVL